tara:strand:- start:402 stop:875 length:474 start_codon:yes stop_codon:yes gene_type:complete
MIKYFIILLFVFSCDDDSGGGFNSPDDTEENINLPIHWDNDLNGVLDNYNDFENSGSITCIVNNEEGYMVGEGDMLSAYINGEQRGVAIASETPEQLTDYTYQFLLLVYGDVSNVPINFKYYKHAEDVIFDILNSREYVVNMTEGIVTNPIILEIDE